MFRFIGVLARNQTVASTVGCVLVGKSTRGWSVQEFSEDILALYLVHKGSVQSIMHSIMLSVINPILVISLAYI